MLTEISSTREGLLRLSPALLQRIVRNEPIAQFYDVEETPFARGKFATVKRACHKETRVAYAAKFVKKRRRLADQTPEIHHEIAVLLTCAASARVVRLHEVFETASEVALVLELAAGGELQRVLEADECLAEAEARRAMKQILDGLVFLHERHIVHLDLKPQNLLLANGASCDDIKLCDFGISRIIQPGAEVRELIGTPDYVAPEVLSYDPISLATDVWSVGVLTYVLLTGYSPFAADDKQQTYLNISKCNLSFDQVLFEDISSAAIDFIRTALVLDPRQRPTVKELTDHPWISAKIHLHPTLSLSTEVIVTKTTSNNAPASQRKSLLPTPIVTKTATPTTNTSDTPKTQRKSYKTEATTFAVTSTCLCPQQRGVTCRHLPHTTVAKTTIVLDCGILC